MFINARVLSAAGEGQVPITRRSSRGCRAREKLMGFNDGDEVFYGKSEIFTFYNVAWFVSVVNTLCSTV